MSSKVQSVLTLPSGNVLVLVEHLARDSFSRSVTRVANRFFRNLQPARTAYGTHAEFAYRDETGTDPNRKCISAILYITDPSCSSEQIRRDLYGHILQEFRSDPWYGWRWSMTGQGMV
jgi:hypothetical protein